MSGSTIVVGAGRHAASAGRAYVFTKAATGWQQAAELVGSDTAAGDGFGLSVAVSGSTIVVGAPLHASKTGRAYVFTKAATGWQQAAELVGSGTAAGDAFGLSVAVSGSTIVVGDPEHASRAGGAYVFTEAAAGWQQAAELVGSDTAAGDEFGYAVAVSGSRASIAGGSDAYVFGAQTAPTPPPVTTSVPSATTTAGPPPTISTGPAFPCPACGYNLILNPGAEAGPGTDDNSVVQVPDWQQTGGFTAAQYAWAGGDLSATTPGPTDRGANYFYGGPAAALSTGTQLVTPPSAGISTGRVFYALSAWLGGFQGQDDDATLEVTFENAGGTAISTSTIGPVTASQRLATTELVFCQASGVVPAATRSVLVELALQRYEGVDDDGLADNLSLVFSTTPPPPTMRGARE